MSFSTLRKYETNVLSDSTSDNDKKQSLIPGLPDDMASTCLALVGWSSLPNMRSVSKEWKSFVSSDEFKAVRKPEELLYAYAGTGDRQLWEVLDSSGRKVRVLPPIPGPPSRSAFGVVVLGQKLLVLGGFSLFQNRNYSVLSDVYEFDVGHNRWTKLASMNVARYNFACAELNGKIYAVGGKAKGCSGLTSVEVYDPQTNRWTVAQSIPKPRYSYSAFSANNLLYVIGTSSDSRIGTAVFVDLYDPQSNTWRVLSGPIRSREGLVGSGAVMGNRVFCSEWKDPTKIWVFDTETATWDKIHVPFGSGTSGGFGVESGYGFGSLEGKLLLLPNQQGREALTYDPNRRNGSGWEKSPIRLSGPCFTCTTIIT